MLMMTWCDVFDDDELLLRLMLRCVVDCLSVWRQIDIMSCPSLGMESARYAISCTPCRRCAGRIVLIDVQTGAAARVFVKVSWANGNAVQGVIDGVIDRSK